MMNFLDKVLETSGNLIVLPIFSEIMYACDSL
jgi:hypothetical protein